jgi:hypothetical protein
VVEKLKEGKGGGRNNGERMKEEEQEEEKEFLCRLSTYMLATHYHQSADTFSS